MIKKTILLFAISTFIGCEGNSDQPIDMEALRKAIATTHIETAYSNLVTESEVLDASIVNLSNALTVANLLTVKQAWLSCATAYSKTEIFNIGDVRNSYIHYGLYGWGALTTSIETAIDEGVAIETFDLNSLPTNSRGLSAIEYLLFAQSENEALLALSDENRMKYLSLLGENLSEKVNTIDSLWSTQITTFVETPENGLDGGINQLINAINNTLALVKKLKIGLPAGLESDAIDTEALQAEISGNSLELITENLKIIEEVYFLGEPSISQYVASIAGNTEINDAFSTSFGNINTTISGIDQTLALAITDHPDKIAALHEEIGVLVRLFTADVSSILSITVTPTDADGD